MIDIDNLQDRNDEELERRLTGLNGHATFPLILRQINEMTHDTNERMRLMNIPLAQAVKNRKEVTPS